MRSSKKIDNLNSFSWVSTERVLTSSPQANQIFVQFPQGIKCVFRHYETWHTCEVLIYTFGAHSFFSCVDLFIKLSKAESKIKAYVYVLSLLLFFILHFHWMPKKRQENKNIHCKLNMRKCCIFLKSNNEGLFWFWF